MKAIELFIKKFYRFALSHFPQSHIIAASALMICLVVITLLPSEKADAKRNSQQVQIPEVAFENSLPEIEFTAAIAADEAPKLEKHEAKVKPGDTLSAIFKRVGLTDGKMMAFLNNAPESKKLTKLYPGHDLEFYTDESNELVKINYIKSELKSFSYTKQGNEFKYEEIDRQPDIHYSTISGIIETSLYESALKARLDDRLIMELADVFGWDIDFALDIRRGDSFRVVYEEKFLDGEKIGNGSIVAAEFINQKERFQALRYKHENGDISYYTPEGKSMRKAFLRAPLDFRRISSNFNPRRLHPVFKTVRPHRGIDYAAATGTPVWSSGNGRVIASGFTKANGNYIVIQHGNNIQTKYLHLHKRYVKKGQKVKQKQKIGSVGSTGYSTGPHLHYEFLINGVHRNPRTIVGKLPKAESINTSEYERFKQQTKPLLAELDLYKTTNVAELEIESIAQ